MQRATERQRKEFSFALSLFSSLSFSLADVAPPPPVSSASCNRDFTRRLFIRRVYVRAFAHSRDRHSYSERGINTRVGARAHVRKHVHTHATHTSVVRNDPVNPLLLSLSLYPPLFIALLPLEGLLFIYGIHPEIQFGTCACSLR